jgi:hypothetical protein
MKSKKELLEQEKIDNDNYTVFEIFQKIQSLLYKNKNVIEINDDRYLIDLSNSYNSGKITITVDRGKKIELSRDEILNNFKNNNFNNLDIFIEILKDKLKIKEEPPKKVEAKELPKKVEPKKVEAKELPKKVEPKKIEAKPKETPKKKTKTKKKNIDLDKFENLLDFSANIIEVPEKMSVMKKNKMKLVNTLTPKNNLKTLNKQKSIKLSQHADNIIEIKTGKRDAQGNIIFNTYEIVLPSSMKYVDKQLKLREKTPLTKKKNFSTYNKQKSIILQHNDINDIKIKDIKPKIIEEKSIT